MAPTDEDMIEIKCKHISAKIALVRCHLGTIEREVADIRVLNAQNKKRKISHEVVKEVGRDGGGNGDNGDGDSSGGGDRGGSGGIGGETKAAVAITDGVVAVAVS